MQCINLKPIEHELEPHVGPEIGFTSSALNLPLEQNLGFRAKSRIWNDFHRRTCMCTGGGGYRIMIIMIVQAYYTILCQNVLFQIQIVWKNTISNTNSLQKNIQNTDTIWYCLMKVTHTKTLE